MSESDRDRDFRPIKIANGLSVSFADGKAIVLPSRELDPEATLLTYERVAWWICQYGSHPRCHDAQRWLQSFEKQIPAPPPPLTEAEQKRIELKILAMKSLRDLLRITLKKPEREVVEILNKFAALNP